MKAYWGVEAFLCNPNAGTGYRLVVRLATGFPHHRGKSPYYEFGRRLVETQNQSVRWGQLTNLCCFQELKPHSSILQYIVSYTIRGVELIAMN